MVHPEKYSFEELYAHNLKNGGLTTKRQYNGFYILIHSKKGFGVDYFFYKDGRFIKQRNLAWHPQIEEYPKRYIDEVLINNNF
jgi:hypothetical protein